MFMESDHSAAPFKMTLDKAKDFCNNLTAREVTSVWRGLLLK